MNQDIKPNGLEVHANLYKQLEVVIWLQNHDPTRPGHDIKYGLDTDLIKDIGGNFDTEFEKGLEETVVWHLNNNKY